jgi:hypothetical protein
VTRGEAQLAGTQVALVLAGCWRASVESVSFVASQLEAIAPLLRTTGAAALAWRRIRASALADTEAGQALRDAHRHQALQAAMSERIAKRATGLLADAGIDAVLVKGWAIGRLYPEKGLRPYGDIDLCVAPADFAAAQTVLPASEFAGRVDLHRGFEKFGGREWDELLAASSVTSIGGSPIRVLSAEDHLRLLCFHLLRHGGWRPLWLCDVALALESRPSDFDWDRMLRASRREADAIACTIGLAHHLLGARVDDTPLAARARRLPRWVVPAVLKQWGTPHRARLPVGAFLSRPVLALRETPWHFANPVEATIAIGGPWNDWPRIPFQILHAALRTAQFAVRLPQHLETSRTRAAARR